MAGGGGAGAGSSAGGSGSGGGGGGGGREGDWDCGGCGNRNYAFRSLCNRCKQPRLLVDPNTPRDSKWLPRAGDWICTGNTSLATPRLFFFSSAYYVSAPALDVDLDLGSPNSPPLLYPPGMSSKKVKWNKGRLGRDVEMQLTCFFSYPREM